MEPRQVKTAADARKIVEQRGLTHVKVAVTDNDGIPRGKYMARDKFFSALEGGFGFCDVVLGWDSNDQLVDGLTYTGWHTAYPDAMARILPQTCREVPTEGNGMLLFLGETAELLIPKIATIAFLAGVMCFLAALVCFLFETLLATRLLRFAELPAKPE